MTTLSERGSRLIKSAASVILISVLLLVPCFWHTHIEAGDLGSHVYNAWLTTLVQKGQAPGLYVVPAWTNILFDDLLVWSGKLAGFRAGEKITLCLIVLVFFWGTFALVATITRRPPWVLTPAIAMLSYGFTFNAGFCNCYLSVGLMFFALAFLWRGNSWRDWLLGACFILLGIAAHPFGLIVAVGVGIYAKTAEWLQSVPWARWLLFLSTFVVVYAARAILSHYSPLYEPRRKFFLFNGGDQLYLFGSRYGFLGQLVILFGAIIFLTGLPKLRGNGEQVFRVPLELWAALMACALLLPQVVTLPQYATIFGPIVSRLTLITAVLGFAVVASVQPRVWHLVGYCIFALLFFSFLYEDTGLLSQMGDEAKGLVESLPSGARVVQTLGGKRGWRTSFLHVVETECIGHCFNYDNYEPTSLQFRIRVRPGCRISASTMREAVLLQYGSYSVSPDELPLKEIYQCTVADITHLCMKDIVAGQPNCPGCNYAFYGQNPPPP